MSYGIEFQKNDAWESPEIKEGNYLFKRDKSSKDPTYDVFTLWSEDNKKSHYASGVVIFKKNNEGVYEPSYFKKESQNLHPIKKEKFAQDPYGKAYRGGIFDFENIVSKIYQGLNNESQTRKLDATGVDHLGKKEFQVVETRTIRALSELKREVQAPKVSVPTPRKRKK